MFEDQSEQRLYCCIFIANAGQFLKLGKFKAELQQRNVQFEHIQCKTSSSALYILFTDRTKAEHGLNELQQMQNYQGNKYKCKLLIDFKPQKKHDGETKLNSKIDIQCDINEGSFSQVQIGNDRQDIDLFTIQSPLANFSLQEQLTQKAKMVRNAISNQMHRVIQGQMLHSQFNKAVAVKAEKQVPQWAKETSLRSVVMHCPPIYASPVQKYYRSKGEFMIQLLENDNRNETKQFQFKIGSFYRISGSDFHVFGAKEMQQSVIFPSLFLKLLEIIEDVFNEFILEQQKIQLKNSLTNKNYVIIKSSGHLEDDQEVVQHQNNQQQQQIITSQQKYVIDMILVSFQVEEELEVIIQQRLLNILSQKTKDIEIQSNIKTSYEICGDNTFIEQKLGNIYVRITALSFFQVNLATQELMLQQIIQAIKVQIQSKQTLKIADMCCGSGIIGQYIVTQLKMDIPNINFKLLGIDIVPEAISAAQASCERNQITDICSYVCGAIETNNEIVDEQDIVILDPPRSGAHGSVLQALRESKVKMIIYVACNPKALATGLYTLCCIDRRGTVPFYTKSLTAFDMFPGCAHVESIAILQRCINKEGAYQ